MIFGVGSIFIEQGVLTFQDLLQALFGIIFAAMGMGNSQGMAVDSAKADLSTRALFALIDRMPKIPTLARDNAAATTALAKRGAISFRGVKLSYPTRADAPPALDGVDLEIAAGSLVAIVGPSGSGKSSIVNLLERFYEPTAGAILLDGVDIRSIPLNELRSQLAWVQQEPTLFSENVGFNVGYPSIDATTVQATAPTPKLEAAARAVGAHDFVVAMPDGYKTRCGLRGGQLSGGQKQRLCIARALLRDAPVLLLDEATSALDNASEKLVQESIDALLSDKSRSKTAIVIAHRLSTVRDADLVVVLERGRVAEIGTWAELSAKGGAFSAMIALQGLR